MTQPQPPQLPVAQVPCFFMPTPSNVDLGAERAPDGQLLVTLTIMQPMSTTLLVLTAEQAKDLAAKITTAATGIEMPSAAPGVVDMFKRRP